MKKKTVQVLSFGVLLGSFCLSSCGGGTQEYQPKTDLEKIFFNMKKNNFTVDYTDSFVNFDKKERNEKYYYTEYSYQAEGDLGFRAYAQDDSAVFGYTLEEGEVVSGAPVCDRNTGIRYDSIYDYAPGMGDFDISALPKEKNADGNYIYEFGKNKKNDQLFLSIFLNFSYLVSDPEVTLRVVKDTLIVDANILSYEIGEEIVHDTVHTVIYDIGTTENAEIHQYLKDGKTSKKPLDFRFFKVMQPYLFTHNYTLDLDASGMFQEQDKTFRMREYCVEKAVLDVMPNGENQGYLLSQGVVSQFQVANDKVEILSTPMNPDGEFYAYLYEQFLSLSFQDLTYNNFIGYIDEEHENSYIITDNQFVYTMCYLSYASLYDERYCDTVRIEIIDEEKGEFHAYFDFYNRLTGEKLGIYRAEFKDLNQTVIPAVDTYLSLGELPSKQTKEEVKEVLDLFQQGNYSMDTLTGAGMAKCYYTDQYFYEELYGNPENNLGYIKIGDGLYAFQMSAGKVNVDKTKNYINSIQLPGVGSVYYGEDDLGYLSHFDEELYNIDHYDIAQFSKEEYWKINDLPLSNRLFRYMFGETEEILPMGSGIRVAKDEEKQDTRLSFLFNYVASDGSYDGMYTMTYYDIGTTMVPALEAYLEANV